jgi:hypothetical protein
MSGQSNDLSAIEALRSWMGQMPPGPIADLDGLANLLSTCWEAFEGHDEEGMTPRKLLPLRRGDEVLPRMEDVLWEPPTLRFTIERHGAVVLGSKRAELQRWIADIDQLQTSIERIGQRQIRRSQLKLDTDDLASQVVESIVRRQATDALTWNKDGSVKIKVSELIPECGPKQTVSGRRRRFRKALDEQLAAHGWTSVSAYKYRHIDSK